ncbi:MAG: signal peptidase II [Candidatus Kerfeldbacteria bacterium]|nr:signal peptidase II [Candidatus Kerfeldbacteria bacterium]
MREPLTLVTKTGRAALALGLVSAWFVGDRLLKAIAQTADPHSLGSWLAFRPTANTGIAFSLPLPAALATWLMAIAVGLTLVIAVWQWSAGRRWFPWLLVAVGGSSNVLDRLRYDAVIDYLSIGSWSVFNLADVLIVFGLLLLLLPARLTNRLFAS